MQAETLENVQQQEQVEEEPASQYQRMTSLCLESGGGGDDTVQKPPQSGQDANNSALNYILFISAFAVLGSCLRVYMARLFGEDCELDKDLDDWLMPISSNVCVTAGGRTQQNGGALFYDLPANLLGSFFMGLITPNTPTVDRLPFLGSKHPLQKDAVYHTGLGVGLCGSLTTFASWNTQMVVMMDGSYCDLGSQVLSAVFGYILGLMGAIACFHFGRSVAKWVCDLRNPSSRDGITPSNSEDEDHPPIQPIDVPYNAQLEPPQQLSSQDDSSVCCRSIIVRATPFILVSVILLLFIAGYALEGIHFYRTMIAKSMTAPIGALLRWKLSGLNSRPEGAKLPWLPVGTLAANLIASVVSIVCIVFADRFHNEEDLWVDAILFSMRVGFAGCLSTVSSMVKEIVNLSEKYPGHAKSYLYGLGSLLAALSICLPIYSIIGRVG
eukprot:CAMPEP_0117021018 /NCGR_PEP_ID=MMETSP0472-20121206/15904_1 /TAXON_ID=693140 ORGANISM="Tiarina fusus, Strain LIS" /NCGR_SAMPLE_ID=MMETSP0472 /ASSEMBLY_ACC=CAM_ASM_000603 /LENGTH=439 /DNA_ID=CAMNT_0004726379 /DNA_START=115 /DNA_END=1430 /DNA_ORIENTATION=-